MQTLYIGQTLVNDIFLGSRRIDDALRVDRGFARPPVVDGLEVYLTTYETQSYNSGSTTWSDLSGNSRNFSLANPSYWQSGSYNGLWLGYSGSLYSTATASFSNGLPWTFNTTGSAFVVLKKRPNFPSATNFSAWLSFNDGTNTNNDFTNYQRHGISDNTTSPAYAFVYTNSSPNLTTNAENTQDGLFHLVYEGWNSGASKAFIGIDTNPTASGTMDTFINTGSIRLSLGTNARLNQSDSANSAFYEVALYSRKLQGQELEDVKNYFINRYGIV